MYLPLACWFLAESLPENVSVVSDVSEVKILLFCVACQVRFIAIFYWKFFLQAIQICVPNFSHKCSRIKVVATTILINFYSLQLGTYSSYDYCLK